MQSQREEILTEVPRGSILRPLIFKSFIKNIFLFMQNSCLSSYADNNTVYVFDKDHVIMKIKLRKDFKIFKLSRIILNT